jgi:hypothetical protein
MKRLLSLAAVVLLIGGALVLGQNKKAPDAEARAVVIKLFDSLTEDQKKIAVKELDDKERSNERFTPGPRPGLSVDKLTADQKSLLDEVIKTVCSEYGAERCQAVVKQDGEGDRFLTFYGTPKADGKFAWRMAKHHLTLVYAEYGGDKTEEFGPVLLGGNPTKTLWDDEEKIALELWSTLSDAEKTAIKGKGNSTSGQMLAADSGIKIGDLAEKPRGLAKKLLAQRLAVFNADRQKVLEDLIRRDGGVDGLRIAIWGDASKSQHDGGNYHWKIGSAAFLSDWQTAGKEHLHMTIKATKPKS